MQSAGTLTATLNELREQSLVVMCGVKPEQSHPRLGELIGHNLTDEIRIDASDPLEDLRWLRLAASGKVENVPATYAGIATQITATDSGVVIFSSEWTKAGQTFSTELLLWLRDLNRQKRWYALYLPPAANSTGIVEMLLAETGYPGNLRFDNNVAEYSPRLWRAEHLIKNGTTDLCLLIGQPASFSEETLACLAKIKTIIIDPTKPAHESTLWFPVAQIGLGAPGKVHRLDGVPLDIQPAFQSKSPRMNDILLQLVEDGS